MLEELLHLQETAVKKILATKESRLLEDLRVYYLGRKSQLRQIMGNLGELPLDQRPQIGQAAGSAQKAIKIALSHQLDLIREAKDSGSEIDVTLPGRAPTPGTFHPLAMLSNELTDIFRGMGFELFDGPETEDEYHNFDALNTPDDHPARDLHDTFYLKSGGLLRTHTSTVQIRLMENQQPPIRMISSGRCYRKETVDATHHFAFHQMEGLFVDHKVSFADLKGTIECMGRQLLGSKTQVRFRSHFFPFTEPSVEYDFSCSICSDVNRKECRICKGTGWIEIAGAGMVDPAVFESVGYDPEIYTGFAFGMGLERIAMIRYGIDDVRLFLENDLKFIRQFSSK
jgi:phenylalanyl-tRNA synthetase alpha chain